MTGVSIIILILYFVTWYDDVPYHIDGSIFSFSAHFFGRASMTTIFNIFLQKSKGSGRTENGTEPAREQRLLTALWTGHKEARVVLYKPKHVPSS